MLIGILSLTVFGFLVYKQNRVDVNEINLAIWEVASLPVLIGVICCWLTLIAVSLTNNQKMKYIGFLAIGLLIVFYLFIAGSYSETAITKQNPYARISFGAGFWLSLLAISIIAVDLNNYFKSNPKVRFAFLTGISASIVIFFATGHLNSISVMKEFLNNPDKFFEMLNAHIFLSTASIGLAMLFGIPLGILAYKTKFLEKKLFYVLNIVQTIPSLALFGILVAPFAYLSSKIEFLQQIGFYGIGWAPALTALFLFSLLPVVSNTYTAFKTVPQSAIEAGVGMGMTHLQLMVKVQLPIVAPLVLNGIRVALVQVIGNTTVAAFIGAGGMGYFVQRGINDTALDLILLGVIPTVILAVIADSVMQLLINILKPKNKYRIEI